MNRSPPYLPTYAIQIPGRISRYPWTLDDIPGHPKKFLARYAGSAKYGSQTIGIPVRLASMTPAVIKAVVHNLGSTGSRDLYYCLWGVHRMCRICYRGGSTAEKGWETLYSRKQCYPKICLLHLLTNIGIPLVKVFFTPAEGCTLIEDIIYQLETYDTTTIRASIPNYIVSKHVRGRGKEKVIFMGEGSDEVAQGYQYFKKAPTAEEGYQESVQLVKNLYKADVLRTDRCTAAHGLEVRVPFLDKQFIETIYSLPRKWVGTREGITKSLIRSAFDPKITGCESYLPHKVLYRQKEAFSDAVGYDWRKCLKEKAERIITDETMSNATELYPHNTPKSKEAMLYRQIYDSWYKDIANVDKYWMPEETWFDTEISDPSALVLDCYKNSNEI